jgi:hypothetical protein
VFPPKNWAGFGDDFAAKQSPATTPIALAHKIPPTTPFLKKIFFITTY